MSWDNPVPSPCISVCLLNEDDVCTGCYRNVEEIAGWHNMTNHERGEVIVVAQERRKKDSSVFLN